MRRPSPTALRSGLYAALGVIVGLVIGIAVVGRFDDPGWFEAAGVWAGAAATVGAIVWAVNSFTYEQKAERERGERAQREAALDRLKTARLVTVQAFAGGGFGGPGEQTMTSVQLVITNASPHSATRINAWVPDLTGARRELDMLPPGTTDRTTPEVTPTRVTNEQLSGGALGRVPCMAYTVDGQRWQRFGDADPEPLAAMA